MNEQCVSGARRAAAAACDRAKNLHPVEGSFWDREAVKDNRLNRL